VILIAPLILASITFLSPQQGSQAIGPLALEITTDAKSVDRVEFLVDGSIAGVARTPPWRVAHDFGTSLDAHIVSAIVWSNHYRTSEKAEVRTAAIAASESVNVDLVEVPLRVRSSRTVKAPDLRLTENGVPQTIREVRPQRDAARFVFVVDRSLSMGNGLLDEALRAVNDAVTMLRPGDTAQLILFNHNVMPPRPLPLREIPDITPSGGTSLRDALASIPRGPRTYAIAITDGGDRNSELDEEEALRRVSDTNNVIDALVLGSTHSTFLDRAAKNTGGSVIGTSRERLRKALRGLIEDINSRYTLIYQSNATKPGWRAIEIRGVKVLQARKGYFAR